MWVLSRSLSNSVCLQQKVRVAMAFIASAFVVTMVFAQSHGAPSALAAFPDTAEFMSQVAEHQKVVEAALRQYTFTEKTTDYVLDKDGHVRNQHTDTYYVTPTSYEIFTLHVSHDGKPVSQGNTEGQIKKMEQRMKEDERKAQRNETIHPQGQMILADIITRSNFTPIRRVQINGLETIAYSFEPRDTSRSQGNLVERISGDLKGTMWVNPDEKEVVRVEFASVSSLSFGLLGTVKGFQGVTERQKVHGDLWCPTRQEYVANGRELFKGFRIRQVSEYSDYLKATTDVVEQARKALPSVQ
jgi:hypothetical protein